MQMKMAILTSCQQLKALGCVFPLKYLQTSHIHYVQHRNHWLEITLSLSGLQHKIGWQYCSDRIKVVGKLHHSLCGRNTFAYFLHRLSSKSANTVPSVTLSHVKAPDLFLRHLHPLACGPVLVGELSKSPNPCTLSAPVCFTEIQGQRISLSLSLSFNSFLVSDRNMAVARVAPNLGLFLISSPHPFIPMTVEIASINSTHFIFAPSSSLLLLSATIFPFRPLASVGLLLID